MERQGPDLEGQKKTLWTSHLLRQMKTPDGLLRLLKMLKDKESQVELLQSIRDEQYGIEDQHVDELVGLVAEDLRSIVEGIGADVGSNLVNLNQVRLRRRVLDLSGQRAASLDRGAVRYNDLVGEEDEALDLEAYIEFAYKFLTPSSDVDDNEDYQGQCNNAYVKLGSCEEWKNPNYLKDFLLSLEGINGPKALKKLVKKIVISLLNEIGSANSTVVDEDDTLIKVLKFEHQLNVLVPMNSGRYKVQNSAFDGFPPGTQVPPLFMYYLKYVKEAAMSKESKRFYAKLLLTAGSNR